MSKPADDLARAKEDTGFCLGFVKGAEYARRRLELPDTFDGDDVRAMEWWLRSHRKTRQQMEAA